jgi:uncharacterized protein YgiB involved in biofilm formation
MVSAMTPSNLLATALLSVSMLALTGCGKKDDAIKPYKSAGECQADVATDATDEERHKVYADCLKAEEQARRQHEQQTPHYQTQIECANLYGAQNCGLAPAGYYYPQMTGFLFGYLSGVATYQPYYYNQWGVAYSGGTQIGYYRSGYIFAPSGSSWSRGYASTTIASGNLPPLSSTRGLFGGSASVARDVAECPSGAWPRFDRRACRIIRSRHFRRLGCLPRCRCKRGRLISRSNGEGR